jgi:hypothetical protein
MVVCGWRCRYTSCHGRLWHVRLLLLLFLLQLWDSCFAATGHVIATCGPWALLLLLLLLLLLAWFLLFAVPCGVSSRAKRCSSIHPLSRLLLLLLLLHFALLASR